MMMNMLSKMCDTQTRSCDDDEHVEQQYDSQESDCDEENDERERLLITNGKTVQNQPSSQGIRHLLAHK